MPISEQAIRDKLLRGQLEFTVHSVLEAASDLVFLNEIEHVVATGEIIENMPDRGRCLLLGRVPSGGFLHAVIDYADWFDDPESLIHVVTVYRPDPDEWVDGRIRRRQNRVVLRRCHECRHAMEYGLADLDETIRGVHVQMRSVPAWTCPACGARRLSLPVARYVSEYLRRLLTDAPSCPEEIERPLVPTEVVFSSR